MAVVRYPYLSEHGLKTSMLMQSAHPETGPERESVVDRMMCLDSVFMTAFTHISHQLPDVKNTL
jgi:hypothetical protein